MLNAYLNGNDLNKFTKFVINCQESSKSKKVLTPFVDFAIMSIDFSEKKSSVKARKRNQRARWVYGIAYQIPNPADRTARKN